ncbi:hypothetical protein IFM89_008794 [Coptis chinensis]|uniref:NAC domain-containing protein n=1 Tax=Coptis chinensis TaxID=261450 RepID=A0A835GWV3_9MAGN|nr:hypothetical protein IFM89_008794 [Coptis chinensis]
MVAATRRSSGSVSENDERKKKTPVKKEVKKSTKRVTRKTRIKTGYPECYLHEVDMANKMQALHKKNMEYAMKAEMADIRNMLLNGLTFHPTEGQLVNFYLSRKNSHEQLRLCPIPEVQDLYAKHPKTLIEEVSGHNGWYFFTCSRPNEPGVDVQREWVFAEKEDIIQEDKKIGLRQVFEFYEDGEKKEYRLIEYQLYPASAPKWPEDYTWVLCKLYVDSSYVAVQTLQLCPLVM